MPTETAIGDLLITEGVVDRVGLSRAQEIQKTRGIALTEAIVELGLADEKTMVIAIAKILRLGSLCLIGAG
jgi:hypothetical protein